MRFPAAPSDQLMYLNLATDDGQARIVLTFEGRLDPGRMARAAELKPVFRRIDGGGADEFVRFMAEAATPGRPPQVQVRLYRTDRDVLCIKISHLVADGAGALDYIGRLARIYRALGIDAAYRPQPDLRLSRHPAQVLRHVSRSELARALHRRPVPQGLARWGLPPAPAHPSPPVFLVRRIGVERLAGLLRYARSQGTSLTELLLAAYFRSLFEVLDPPAGVPLPVAVPINLRRYLPSGAAGRISNLTGALLPAVSREPGAAFGATLAQVHAAMQAAHASHPELAQVVYGSLALLPGVAVMRRLARRYQVACPAFANLGVIDPAAVHFGGAAVCDVSMFGPVQYPPAFGLSVNTFHGAATVTTGTCGEAPVQRLLDRFLKELPA
ncbi:MAG: hypothetical protein LAQ30_25630 [Acidobacteriia bacterium]|nr:hypothetical protein [Terriglobia bacterium]